MQDTLEDAISPWVKDEVARHTDEHGTVWVVARSDGQQDRYDVFRCWKLVPLGTEWMVSVDLHASDDAALIRYLMRRT